VIIYCATTNRGKLREFRLAAETCGHPEVVFEPLPGIREIVPPEETGHTFAENAVLKAEYYSRFTEGTLFAEDSGLAVDALGGAPGVYSARFAGNDATDEANNRLVLERLAGVQNRSARFVCVIALARQGRTIQVIEGSVEGEILDETRGTGGFGYDPLFYYPPKGCAFAELTAEEKLSVSHRGCALRALIQYLSYNSGAHGTTDVDNQDSKSR